MQDENGKQYFDIEINNVYSHFFGYLINTSRLYWRKELETNFDDREAAAEYHAAHKFDIAGQGLTPDEIAEQNRILLIRYLHLAICYIITSRLLAHGHRWLWITR